MAGTAVAPETACMPVTRHDGSPRRARRGRPTPSYGRSAVPSS